jgi:hypothetical protein
MKIFKGTDVAEFFNELYGLKGKDWLPLAVKWISFDEDFEVKVKADTVDGTEVMICFFPETPEEEKYGFVSRVIDDLLEVKSFDKETPLLNQLDSLLRGKNGPVVE